MHDPLEPSQKPHDLSTLFVPFCQMAQRGEEFRPSPPSISGGKSGEPASNPYSPLRGRGTNWRGRRAGFPQEWKEDGLDGRDL